MPNQPKGGAKEGGPQLGELVGGFVFGAVIHHDDLYRPGRKLLAQALEAVAREPPLAVDRDDDAEHWGHGATVGSGALRVLRRQLWDQMQIVHGLQGLLMGEKTVEKLDVIAPYIADFCHIVGCLPADAGHLIVDTFHQSTVHDRKPVQAEIDVMGDIVHLGWGEADIKGRDSLDGFTGQYVAAAHDVCGWTDEIIESSVIVPCRRVETDAQQIFPGHGNIAVEILEPFGGCLEQGSWLQPLQPWGCGRGL